MEIISSDTNIWFDFNAIDRIEIPFRLSCQYIMYEEAMRLEVVSPPELLKDLKRLGLRGVDLETKEFEYADQLGKYKKLSGYDRTALAIAKCRGITLLTGDNALRKAAREEGVRVIGTIGLLDRLYSESCISPTEYIDILDRFKKHPERRLPDQIISDRIRILCTKKEGGSIESKNENA